MPPRGYRNFNGGKPTIPAATRQAAKTITEMITERLRGDVDSNGAQSLDSNEILKTQKVPRGYEPAPNIPTWMTEGANGSQAIKAQNLHHAIRIKGTDYIMTSETPLSEKQLESVAHDFNRAVVAAGHMFPEGVAMHIPTTQDWPGAMRSAHGYVQMSEGKRRVFYLRPSRAKNLNETKYHEKHKLYREQKYKRHLELVASRKKHGLPSWNAAPASGAVAPTEEVRKDDVKFGWSMPIAEIKGNERVYIMVHEMGHNYDDTQGHTGKQMDLGHRSGDTWKTLKPGLSVYGKSNRQEGYAEAFAQYHLGGRRSNQTADKYARIYGWMQPLPPITTESITEEITP
jgi:hypothetical protein